MPFFMEFIYIRQINTNNSSLYRGFYFLGAIIIWILAFVVYTVVFIWHEKYFKNFTDGDSLGFGVLGMVLISPVFLICALIWANLVPKLEVRRTNKNQSFQHENTAF